MSKTYRAYLAFLALAALPLGACGAYGPNPGEGLSPGEPDPDDQWQVQFNDDLAGELKILPVKVERTATGNIRVHVPIWNMTDEDLELLVQAEFRDHDGIPYGDETNRERVAVPRGSTKTWSKESLQSRAQKFTVKIWRWRE